MLLSKEIIARVIALGLVTGSAACLRLQDAPDAWACETDDDCEAGQVCFRSPTSKKQTCRSEGYCELDVDCSDLQVCRDRTCADIECKEGRAEACSPFVCRDDACLTECESWDDCIAGHACDRGSCVPSECTPGASAKDCDGFACVEGLCLEECERAIDCATDFVCKQGSCAPVLKPDGSSCEVAATCLNGLCCPADAVDTYQCGSFCRRRDVGEACEWGAICLSLRCEDGVCVRCEDDECRSMLCGGRNCGTFEEVDCGVCEGETFCSVASKCQPWTECAPGTEPASTPSSTEDRVCTECAAGRYSTGSNSTCKPWSSCAGIENVPPSASRDRSCYEGWNRTYGTATRAEAGNALTLVAGGDAITGGQIDPELDDPSDVHQYAYVRRIASVDGEITWEQLIGTQGWNNVWSVDADSSGNVYAAGYISAGDGGLSDDDAFVQKLSVSDGAPIWTKRLATDAFEGVQSVVVAPDGNVLITGNTRGALAGTTSGGNTGDVFVFKLSSTDGAILWQTQFGPGHGYGIAANSVGDVFVASDANVAATEPDGDGTFTVHKLSGATGAEIWTRRMGQFSGEAYTVVVDGSDDVLVAGQYDAVAAVMKLDGGDGARLWTRQFTWAPNSAPWGLELTPNGTLLVAGTTEDYLELENELGGGFVLELSSSDGSSKWVEQFGVRYRETPQEVALDGSGDVWLAGGRLIEAGGDLHWNSFVAKIVRE